MKTLLNRSEMAENRKIGKLINRLWKAAEKVDDEQYKMKHSGNATIRERRQKLVQLCIHMRGELGNL